MIAWIRQGTVCKLQTVRIYMLTKVTHLRLSNPNTLDTSTSVNYVTTAARCDLFVR